MIKLIGTLFLCLLTSVSLAKNISVFIPFSPGSPTDQLWRAIEPELNERLKKHDIKLITENVPGAGGAVAGNRIVDTTDRLILAFYSPALVIAPAMNPDVVRYNKDSFRLIGYAGSTEMIVVSSLTLAQFTKKCKNERLTFGSSNIGSTSHLIGTVIGKELKCIDVLHVPYKGQAAAYPDLAAGRIDYLVEFAITGEPKVSAGQINKLFAVDKRFSKELENWHVFIANRVDSPDYTIIKKEFENLKKDKVFVEQLEKSYYIKNFSEIKNEQWFKNEFEVFEKFVKNLK